LLNNSKIDFVQEKLENVNGILSPLTNNIFNAFSFFNVEDLKVVILAQDPYPGEGDANGLAFSVDPGKKLPASLRNIYKEIVSEGLLKEIPKNGDLEIWAEQGVLLLNCALTLENGTSNSHKDIWKDYTDELIKWISDKTDNTIFLLFGGFAKKKAKLLDATKHNLIYCAHPSPLSANRGFFGSGIFKKVNELLDDPIIWC
jgi:uracil-DNA glycosylase